MTVPLQEDCLSLWAGSGGEKGGFAGQDGVQSLKTRHFKPELQIQDSLHMQAASRFAPTQ